MSAQTDLNTPIKYIRGVGPKRATALATAGIDTVNDLLHYYPRRYLDRTTVKSIHELKKGDQATMVGTVEVCGERQARKRKLFQAVLSDSTGMITLVWFNGVKYIKNAVQKGDRLAVHGKVEFYNGFQIVHPDFDKLNSDADPINTGTIIPLYPLTAELKKVRIDHRSFRRIIKENEEMFSIIEDHFEESVLNEQKLIPLQTALQHIHFPESRKNLLAAMERLKFDEHYFLQLLMALRKKSYETIGTNALTKSGPHVQQIETELGFELTAAQQKVIQEIRIDIARPQAMNRLLQGDVGSGKTIVAILVAAAAVANGVQVAVMAPTEILAHQHFESFKKQLNKVHISCALLVGKQKATERKQILEAVKNGKINVVIGTHALIQDEVEFKNLGFVVVDEQHRFGVVQRGILLQKGPHPHLLAMTATPIPRTMAITYHGDMDLSIIDEMPKDRKPVITKIVKEDRLQNVYKFICEEVQAGRQCMVVYPLVEETEKSDLADATEGFEALQNIFKGIKIGLIHGRMKKEEKDAIMNAYAKNEIKILVSTTVIEVGIDIPNASVMLIEHAERFGLTQLHQLRGRVGRGSSKSYCILVERNIRDTSRKRLAIMEKTNNGFIIADEDLKMRGPGKFFSTEQSGFFKHIIADMVTDGAIIRKAREVAQTIAETDTKLENNPRMKKRLLKDYAQYLDTVVIS
ncbi:MAG: ATP-dependent DNA helicase RecG [Candidatus Marinimicrobia bacterium]|nr:ATP-dependent DNA helicase RecG [Candidatus Neomarinimicrobiota bacterium]MDP6725692.1 ATP-dependent DNA helicase RecG [Candidatus Neomarinimicrobiota bacterium]